MNTMWQLNLNFDSRFYHELKVSIEDYFPEAELPDSRQRISVGDEHWVTSFDAHYAKYFPFAVHMFVLNLLTQCRKFPFMKKGGISYPKNLNEMEVAYVESTAPGVTPFREIMQLRTTDERLAKLWKKGIFVEFIITMCSKSVFNVDVRYLDPVGEKK